jgi:hypothetical protein
LQGIEPAAQAKAARLLLLLLVRSFVSLALDSSLIHCLDVTTVQINVSIGITEKTTIHHHLQ